MEVADVMDVILTRTPLRISIGGGGTDLPSYYEKFGGYVISAAINKYVFVGMNRTFASGYMLKYSALEHAATLDEIRHPMIREAFRMHAIEPSTEIMSMADIPAGTGLGSSGTFAVGLLKAIHAWKRKYSDPLMLAEEACHLEMNILEQPVGKQDQYIASFGGIACLNIQPDGKVDVSPLKVSVATIHELEDQLLMFFTGYTRSASNVLNDQKCRTETGDSAMIDNLHFIKSLGLDIQVALESGNTARFGTLMHEHWLHKMKRSPGTSNERINRLYDIGKANGALGGKLVGAGGGGFLLFYAEDRAALRKAMAAEGLMEVHFKFDMDGSTVVARD